MKWLFLYLSLCIPAEAFTPGLRETIIRPSPLPIAAALNYLHQAAVNGCATPTNNWQGNVTARINNFYGHGYSTFDAIYFLGAPDACIAKINVVTPASNTLVQTGTCKFIPYWGLIGDGSTCYWSMVSNLNALTQFTQNNAHLGVYVSSGLGNTGEALGTSATGNLAIRTAIPTAGRITRLNNNASLTDGTASFPGYSSARRQSSTTVQTFFNSAVLATDSATSNAVQSVPLTIERFGSVYAAQLVCEVDIGAPLSAAQEAWFFIELYKFGCGGGMVR